MSLPDASAGQQQLVTKTTQAGENAVAITVEPAGGSATPTLPIVWQTTLTSYSAPRGSAGSSSWNIECCPATRNVPGT